jgi:hypothetical protein
MLAMVDIQGTTTRPRLGADDPESSASHAAVNITPALFETRVNLSEHVPEAQLRRPCRVARCPVATADSTAVPPRNAPFAAKIAANCRVEMAS